MAKKQRQHEEEIRDGVQTAEAEKQAASGHPAYGVEKVHGGWLYYRRDDNDGVEYLNAKQPDGKPRPSAKWYALAQCRTAFESEFVHGRRRI